MSTWREQRNARRSVSHDPKFTDIHPQHKPDMVGDAAGGHPLYPREATSHESQMAKHGFTWAAHNPQTPIPFTPTNGLHCVGSDCISEFSRAVNYSGGVRQGHTFTSDPATGVARASVEGSVKLHMQGQGSGETFRVRQHRRWAGNGG